MIREMREIIKKGREIEELLKVCKRICKEPKICRGKECKCYCIGLDGKYTCALSLLIDEFSKEEQE